MNYYTQIKSKLQSQYTSRFIEGVSLGILDGEIIGIMANHQLSHAYLGDAMQQVDEIVIVSIYSNSYHRGYALALEVLNSLITDSKINQALTSTYSNTLEKYVIEFSIKGE